MKKRLLAVFMCFCMITALLPVTAFAGDNYAVFVAGTEVTADNAADVLGDGTVSYDAEANTLTLKNADIAADDFPYGIYAEGDLTILLEGENTVRIADAVSSELPFPTGDLFCISAVLCYNGNLVIKDGDGEGQGSLSATAIGMPSEYNGNMVDLISGIVANSGSLTIEKAKIDAEGGLDASAEEWIAEESTDITAAGMFAGEDISVTDANVTAAGNSFYDNTTYSYGIYSASQLESSKLVFTNSTVTATAQVAEQQSRGIRVFGDIQINGGKVTAYGGSYNYISWDYTKYGGALSTEAGDISIQGEGTEVMLYGGYSEEGGSTGLEAQAGSITISDKAYVKATTWENEEGSAYAGGDDATNDGIYANGDIVVSDATIIALGCESGYRSTGLYSETGNIVLNGSVQAVGSRSHGYSAGIRAQAGSVTIDGGKISTEIGMTESLAADGIYAFGDIQINGGEVATIGSTNTVDGVAPQNGTGIFSEQGNVTITGAETSIHAFGGFAHNASTGIAAQAGDVKIEDGSVLAYAFSDYFPEDNMLYGISAKQGDDGKGGSIFLCGGKVDIFGNSGALYYDNQMLVSPAPYSALTVKTLDELLAGEYMGPDLEAMREQAAALEGSPFETESSFTYAQMTPVKYLTLSTQHFDPPATYTVTFDANGHGTAPQAITGLLSGSTITEPTAPAEEGWEFGGWYKDAACENKWDFAADTVTENITLYAKWTQKPAESTEPTTQTTPENPEIPKTGEFDGYALLFVLLFAASSTGLTFAYQQKRKSKSDK